MSSDDVIIVPTFGKKSISLGGFYSAISETFLPSGQIWPSEVIDRNIITQQQTRQSLKWTKHLSIKDKVILYLINHVVIFGSVRSSRNSNLCLSVCPIKIFLELTILIFLSQSQVSFMSLSSYFIGMTEHKILVHQILIVNTS